MCIFFFKRTRKGQKVSFFKMNFPDAGNTLQEQKFAISILRENLNIESSFKFIDYLHFKEKFLLIHGMIKNDNVVIFPLSHDWKIPSKNISDFAEFQPELKHLLSMAAPDGSCIIYELKSFDFANLTENSQNSDSD